MLPSSSCEDTDYSNKVPLSGSSPGVADEFGHGYPCSPGERALPSTLLVYGPTSLAVGVSACYCFCSEGMQSASLPEALALCGLLSTLYSVSFLFLVGMLLGEPAYLIKKTPNLFP